MASPLPASPPLPPEDGLVALFEARGFARLETPILQPAAVFLDLSGEAIRRRLFLTQDGEGREWCLRPEHTIPVVRHHLEQGTARADYCYRGPVFRQRAEGPAEFHQAGVESIGGPDQEASDAEILAVATAALALWPDSRFDLETGDMGLLDAVLRALEVPPAFRRRMVRRLAAAGTLDEALEVDGRTAAPDYAGLLAAIEGQDPRAARAFVEDVISIAGIAQVGGRTAGEIADRFLSRAARRGGALPDGAEEVLRRFLAVRGDLRSAAESVGTLADEARIDLSGALGRIRRFCDHAAARGLDLSRIGFATDFVRDLDYYTGFVFEFRDGAGRVVAGGGRYDGLLSALGSPVPVPAVGCSFWLDRLGDVR